MIYDRLKLIEEAERRPSQGFVEFQSKLLKDMQHQIGIPDEFIGAMTSLDELSEWSECEQHMERVLKALALYDELKQKRAELHRTIREIIFWIGLLLGIALITIL